YWEPDKRKIPLNISPMIRNVGGEYTNSFKPILTQDVRGRGYEKGDPPTKTSFADSDYLNQATRCDSVGTCHMYQQGITSLMMESKPQSAITSAHGICTSKPLHLYLWKALLAV